MRRLIAFAATLACGVALTPTATGAPPTVVSFEVFDEFHAPFTSELCGVEVWIRLEGTVRLTVFHDQDGAVVRELDTSPGFRTTFSSPETGMSFSFPEALVWHYAYPEGASVGAPARVTITGLQGAPAITAGRVVEDGEVVGISPDGVPFVDPIGFVSANGRFPDEETYLAARCEALGGQLTWPD